jgi:acetoin utilization deacetylase AcuC-like enzyme
MAITGIFFHPLMSEYSWPVIGAKFKDFPDALRDVLLLPNVRLYTPDPVDEGLLSKIHTSRFLEREREMWYYEAARRAVGGCVAAGRGVAEGWLTNALAFSVAAGHHAGRSCAWGGTYLSCTGPAVQLLRDEFSWERIAILDTDCHHGDGTRTLFRDDPNVLHVCFCNTDAVTADGTKIDIRVGWRTTDRKYLRLVEKEFNARVEEFRPKLIFHDLGHDTCQGDYGDRGLTPQFFPALAGMIRDLANRCCGGRYIVVTHSGARADVAKQIFPEIVRILAS